MTKTRRVILRMFVSFFYVTAALALPWWLTTFITPILILFFYSYFEALFVGLVIDVLYSAPNTFFFGFRYLFTLYAAILIVGLFFLKKRLALRQIG